MLGERGLFKKGIYIVILKATGIILSYAFTLFITNYFGARAYGQYSLFFAIINIGAVVALFGTERSVIKLYNQEDLEEGRINVLHSFLGICISAIAVATLLYFTWPYLAANFFTSSPEIVQLQPFAFILIGYSLFVFIAEAIRARNKMKLYGLFRFNALFIFALVFLYSMYRGEVQWAPIKSFVYAAAVVAVIGLGLFIRDYGLRVRIRKVRMKRIFDISYPMLLASSMGLIIGWVDTFMLGYFADERAVGIYNVAYKVAFVSAILLTTITTVISPRVARLSSLNENEALRKLIQGVGRILFFGAGFIFLVSILNLKLILSFFGQEFIEGGMALAILLIGQFISSYSGPVAMLLQMSGHERNFMYISITAMLINVLLNLLLIPRYGYLGAAIASAVTLIVNNLACVYIVKRKLGFYSFYLPFRN